MRHAKVFFIIIDIYLLYLTASFNSLPRLKAGTFEAAISISSPVCGLRPFRAVTFTYFKRTKSD